MSTYSLLTRVTTLVIFSLLSSLAFAQSTGAIQGVIVDPAGAPIPNASLTLRNEATGAERSISTDAAGAYSVPSLAVGTYQITAKSPGMAQITASNIVVSVGTITKQDFTLQVASATAVVEIQGTAPVVEAATIAMGTVVDQRAVQEVPLNGRHFVDLAYLTVGTVTPPANGSLTAPLRGQGSFSFNSAGAREDSVNFMINGINLSDPIQNQITFQPTVNTVDEFKVDNSTFSPEYGRNSGAIVNIATRSGVNQWHGEAYEFLRNNDLDARNYSNPTNISSGGQLVPNPMSPFKRNQFGGDGGGALRKDKDFFYLSYEALRQRQAVPISTTTLTAAQVAAIQATSDAFVKSLLPLIPAANSGTNQYVASAIAPVNIQQGTANGSHIFSDADRLNVYYAIQADQRNEPPSTDGNSFPGEGDMRTGRRQLLTINDSWVISPNTVNEARLGYNRILINFLPAEAETASSLGIDSGVGAGVSIPQISISGAFTFGGISGFPQGRGDNTVVASDTLSIIKGNHTLKMGGEFRRANSDNYSYTPGTFTFASVAAFTLDEATGFTSNASNKSNRTYANALGFFLNDAWKVSPTFLLNLGLRYDYYGTPTEAENRFVVFDPASVTLQDVGKNGGPAIAYNQSALNFEPRIGFAWDPFRNGKTVVRSAYAIMTDQPTLGLVSGLAGNPPYSFPVSFSPSKAIPYVSLGDAFALASGSVSPLSIAHNYKDAYFSEWNFNIQQEFAHNYGLMVGYFASKGTDLNVERNYNQVTNGVRPYTALSASSPIDPGMPLSNIGVYESDGNSSYNALWVTLKKQFAKGLQFNTSYSLSKSIDDNSRNVEGLVLQDSNNINGDRGLSDFDTRNRIVVSGVYTLPFKGNRLVEGWEVSLIEQTQSGNPINFHTTNSSFTGSALLRPDVTGTVITGFEPASNGSASSIGFIQNPSVFTAVNGFGNLGRNVIIGPGFSNLDFALVKNTRIKERLNFQIRADAFDLLNQTNFTQPVSTVGSSTLGLITGGTRFPAGDGGTSRQLQLAMKLVF